MPVFGCGLSMRASLVYPFGHGDQRIERVGGHQVGQRMLAYPRPTLSASDSSPSGIPRFPGARCGNSSESSLGGQAR